MSISRGPSFTFTAELWEYSGQAAWIFVSVPADMAEDIRTVTDGRRGGFGTVKVQAGLGSSYWSTSLFPSSADGTFLLPVKRAIRRAHGVEAGDPVTIVLELLL
ncbi:MULTISPECIES: DUF1905 domain-containing protein [Cryobacterium]|uniref:DUF1905 domain-containing protein n=1 Tax=Cryobacterium breve TaxID=1259258 RepID=A0ABY2J2W6_9MICO|nr:MULTISPECIES: DUF1905 domain-containing protein [Cryobacterium]TFC90958.1 DUF1905 domain-containing protein [Cryobacterium sp. TmT3-12]TFC99277.1 DUF1905 domain-containing protein [Cryobacterium breve]